MLRPGGILFYSTCTLNPSENERVVSRFLEEKKEEFEPYFLDLPPEILRAREEPAHQLTIFPQMCGTDGFFIAGPAEKNGVKGMERVDIKSMTLPELKASLAELGQPAYRAGQIYQWLHRKSAWDFSAMTNLSRPLRNGLPTIMKSPGRPLRENMFPKLTER